MSTVATTQLDHEELPVGEMTVARARQELDTHRGCPTTVCRRKAQAKAVVAEHDRGISLVPAPSCEPGWRNHDHASRL